jgi:hypothetical protein
MYFTRNRGARLITGDDPLPLPITKAASGTVDQKAREAVA